LAIAVSGVVREQRLPRHDSQCQRTQSFEILETGALKRRKTAMQKFLRVSSALILVGLMAEVASLLWFHPLAFVLFVFVGASLMAIGMLLYLLSLVFVASGAKPSSPAE
jgi:hypothetical protein